MKNESSLRMSSYSCEKCCDRGWILIPQQDSAPLAVRCQCSIIEKSKKQWIAAGINPENSTKTFSNFEIWNENSRKVKLTAAAYYRDFKNLSKSRKNSILLCGQSGSGKTHATLALSINLLKSGVSVVYMPYRDVITKIKQNMLDYEFYSKHLSRYQTCEVLLMDDLFKGKINDSDINIVFEIINYRYMNYLPTIVSTEFSLDRLLDFDEAIGSRIYEMCKDYIVVVPKTKSNNYRLRKIEGRALNEKQ